jgi:mitochondrial cardiolipin hydrolase
MRQGRITLLIFAVGIIALFVGITIGSTSSSRTSETVTEQLMVTSLTTVTVQSQGQPGFTEYCFSSGYGTTADCAGLVVRYISQAATSIHALMYSLTLPEISDALIAAKNRGVDVEIVMDRTQAKQSSSQYQPLINAGVRVRLDRGAYEMHDKVAIIDGHIIITGSFNWTKSANENNDENLVVLDSQTWASVYEQQFQQIWTTSA